MNPTQVGIPSPNPNYQQEIEQIKEVKYCGTAKNLLNFNEISGKTNNIEYSVNGIYININGTPSGAYATSKKMRCNIKKNEVVTIKITSVKSGTYRLWIRNKKNEMITNPIVCNSSTSGIKTITAKDNVETVQLVIEGLTAGATYTDTVTIQIEKGQNATEIEEHKEQTVAIDLKGNKLCAISDTIKDKLLIDRNGNVAIQKNVDMYTITGNEKFEFLLSNGIGQINFDVNCRLITNQSEDFSALSNFFKKEKVWGGSWLKDNICIQRISVRKLRLQSSKFTTIDEAKDFFKQQYEAGNPVIVYFQAESKLIDLGQLTELPKTFEGINNIWAETNLGNTEIEIEYVQDVKKLLEKQAEQQNARLDNIETLLSTTQTSALLLDNMQSDLESEVE